MCARATSRTTAWKSISGKSFLGLIYVDDEDGDKSYNFQMAILEEDLADVT